LAQYGTSICWLVKVAIWAADDPGETSFCEVYEGNDGYWQLKASSAGDSRVDCQAVCMNF
jgi:hypothetical protein